MAGLWTLHESTWTLVPLPATQAVGLNWGEGQLHLTEASAASLGVFPTRTCGRVEHGLVGPPGSATINGRPFLGAACLGDKDELLLAGRVLYYGAQHLPRPLAQAPLELECDCTLCGAPLDGPALQCPLCGAWYHQSELLPCWVARQQCAVLGCPQETCLQQQQWNPLSEEFGDAYGCAVASE